MTRADQSFRSSTSRLVEASLCISIDPLRVVRTATNDVCLSGIVSGDTCLFAVSLSCLYFCCTVAIYIPDRGRGCFNSIVERDTPHLLCALCGSGPRTVPIWQQSHHRSRGPGPLTPFPAGACIDSIKDDQSRASERRPYHFEANASNFHAGYLIAGPGLACGDVTHDPGSISGASWCRNMVPECLD